MNSVSGILSICIPLTANSVMRCGINLFLDLSNLDGCVVAEGPVADALLERHQGRVVLLRLVDTVTSLLLPKSKRKFDPK